MVLHRNDAVLHAHDIRFADLLPALAVGAAGIYILAKQLHRTSPLCYSASRRIASFSAAAWIRDTGCS